MKKVFQSDQLLNHYNRIPVMLIRFHSGVPILGKSRYLVDPDLTLANFSITVRRQLDNNFLYDGLFFLINNQFLSNATTFREMKHLVDNNGMLKITYTTENSFG